MYILQWRKMVHALKMKRDTATTEKFFGYEDDIEESDYDSETQNMQDNEGSRELFIDTTEIGTEGLNADTMATQGNNSDPDDIEDEPDELEVIEDSDTESNSSQSTDEDKQSRKYIASL